MRILPKIVLSLSILVMLVFFTVKTAVLLEFIQSTPLTRWTEYMSFITFIPLFYFIVRQLLCKQRDAIKLTKYSKKLNQILVNQSHNTLFYQGNIKESGKSLTKEVTNSLGADRCSIWLYNKEKTSIVCQQLFIKSENVWKNEIELFEKDFKPYFDHLKIDPIIIANDAETHPATSCFLNSYLKPLGIKSMLDVPILFKEEVIGVICIESFESRKWNTVEINFAQILSSLYSFAYSNRQTTKLSNDLIEFDNFVDVSALVSKADYKGKITYVNKKFLEVSGWELEEVLGQDHKIVNSGEHPKEFWRGMYKTVIYDRGIWNAIVTNKRKNGELYWVDSYIKAEFDDDGNLLGFMSIRYDVTDLIKSSIEIKKQNTYLEHAAKILRHDMHSGINTYIPRGISSLERRLTKDDVERLKIEAPLKMIKEGLKHSQKVYKGVYEFTNLVRPNSCLGKENLNLKNILRNYLESTSYNSQVMIEDLIDKNVNESLFCTAIDNLIRNGLKYNDSDTKFVKLYMENGNLCIQDNGRGLTHEEFEHLSQPYTRKENQRETGSGLGLNICRAILKEHGFSITCEKNNIGTKMTIHLK